MMDGRLSCRIDGAAVPIFPEAVHHANEFLLTAAGQKNRNHVGAYVTFEDSSFATEELLFDPQTSGGLLLAVDGKDAKELEKELQKAGLPAKIVGEVTEKTDMEIRVRGKVNGMI